MPTPATEQRRPPTPGAPAPGGAAALLSATAVSVTGDGALEAAVPLLAVTLTSNPLTLSAVSAAALLPWLLFSLHAGALTDRWPRRRTMITADLVCAAALTALTVLLATDRLTIAVLAATVIVVGTAQCFFGPASQGMIPALVGRDPDALTHVNGRYWAIDTAGRDLAGPALGAAAFSTARLLPFAGDAVSFLTSAALLTRLPENRPQRPEPATVTADIREGIRFLRHHRDLRGLLWIVCGNNCAYSIAMATFVLYAHQVLHVPAAAYGLLLAAAAVGGILAGWWARPLTRKLSDRATLGVGCALQGVAWAGTATTHNPWTAAAMLVLIGAASNIGTVALVTIRQQLTPDNLAGRVTSVFRFFGIGVATLAALAGGALAAGYGLHAPLTAATAILLAVTVAIATQRR
jgi:MFS family permease